MYMGWGGLMAILHWHSSLLNDCYEKLSITDNSNKDQCFLSLFDIFKLSANTGLWNREKVLFLC